MRDQFCHTLCGRPLCEGHAIIDVVPELDKNKSRANILVSGLIKFGALLLCHSGPNRGEHRAALRLIYFSAGESGRRLKGITQTQVKLRNLRLRLGCFNFRNAFASI